jgi:hypothetical protein
MGKFTSGLVAGSVIGLLGLGYAMSDKRTRRRMMRDGKRFANKCGDMFN